MQTYVSESGYLCYSAADLRDMYFPYYDVGLKQDPLMEIPDCCLEVLVKENEYVV